MALPDFSASEDKLRDVQEQLREIQNTKMPRTLEDAVNLGIDISSKLSDALLIHYADEERELDDDRCITMKEAQKVLAEMEEKLIEAFIDDGIDSMWKRLAGVHDAAMFLYEHAGDIWDGIFNSLSYLWDVVRGRAPWPSLETILAVVAAVAVFEIATACTMATYGKSVKGALKLADEIEAKMRKAALPQSGANRSRVRRMSR